MAIWPGAAPCREAPSIQAEGPLKHQPGGVCAIPGRVAVRNPCRARCLSCVMGVPGTPRGFERTAADDSWVGAQHAVPLPAVEQTAQAPNRVACLRLDQRGPAAPGDQEGQPRAFDQIVARRGPVWFRNVHFTAMAPNSKCMRAGFWLRS